MFSLTEFEGRFGHETPRDGHRADLRPDLLLARISRLISPHGKADGPRNARFESFRQVTCQLLYVGTLLRRQLWQGSGRSGGRRHGTRACRARLPRKAELYVGHLEPIVGKPLEVDVLVGPKVREACVGVHVHAQDGCGSRAPGLLQEDARAVLALHVPVAPVPGLGSALVLGQTAPHGGAQEAAHDVANGGGGATGQWVPRCITSDNTIVNTREEICITAGITWCITV